MDDRKFYTEKKAALDNLLTKIEQARVAAFAVFDLEKSAPLPDADDRLAILNLTKGLRSLHEQTGDLITEIEPLVDAEQG